jgi:hypothetical protein
MLLHLSCSELLRFITESRDTKEGAAKFLLTCHHHGTMYFSPLNQKMYHAPICSPLPINHARANQRDWSMEFNVTLYFIPLMSSFNWSKEGLRAGSKHLCTRLQENKSPLHKTEQSHNLFESYSKKIRLSHSSQIAVTICWHNYPLTPLVINAACK